MLVLSYLLMSRRTRVWTCAGAQAIVPSLGAVHKIHQSYSNNELRSTKYLSRVHKYQSTKHQLEHQVLTEVPVESAGELGGIGGVRTTAPALGSRENLVGMVFKSNYK